MSSPAQRRGPHIKVILYSGIGSLWYWRVIVDGVSVGEGEADTYGAAAMVAGAIVRRETEGDED